MEKRGRNEFSKSPWKNKRAYDTLIPKAKKGETLQEAIQKYFDFSEDFITEAKWGKK